MSDGPLKDYPKGLVTAINNVLAKQNDLYSAGLMQKYGINPPEASTPDPIEVEDLGQEVSSEVQDVIDNAEEPTTSVDDKIDDEN